MSKCKHKLDVFTLEHVILHSIKIKGLNEEKLGPHEKEFKYPEEVYIVNKSPKKVEKPETIGNGEPFGPEEVSMHSVSLNPNFGLHGWVASGSACGMLRIENMCNSKAEISWQYKLFDQMLEK